MAKALSFCITCKNRLHQLSRTLKANLRSNIGLGDMVEFVLVDFGSTDGLGKWILQEFSMELDNGFLKYYYTEGLHFWHASRAKNIAHSLASGEIVVNLDCDNFTGNDGAGFLLDQFNVLGRNIIFHQASGRSGDGSFGRVSMLRRNFQLLGGYDESFGPMGFQDVDLIRRASRFGLTYLINSSPKYNQAIPNSKTEGLINTNSTKSYMDMTIENMHLSAKNISCGNITANLGIMETSYEMYHINKGKLIIYKPL